MDHDHAKAEIYRQSLQRFGSITIQAQGRCMLPVVAAGDRITIEKMVINPKPGDLVLAHNSELGLICHYFFKWHGQLALTKSAEHSEVDPGDTQLLGIVTQIQPTLHGRMQRWMWMFRNLLGKNPVKKTKAL